jgi:hypothetical protein
LPWSALMLAAFRPARRRGALYWTSLYGFLIALAVFTLAAGSRDRYMLPAIPFFAILVAEHLDPDRRLPRLANVLLFALLAVAPIGYAAFLLHRGIVLQAVLLIATGLIALSLTRARLRVLELGLAAAMILLLFYEHGIYFYRTVYRPRAYPVAERIERELRRRIPVVVEPRADLIHLAVDLEGMIQQPVHNRDEVDFPEYYLITDLAHREPGGRDLLRSPYSRRRVGEILLQEVVGDSSRGR